MKFIEDKTFRFDADGEPFEVHIPSDARIIHFVVSSDGSQGRISYETGGTDSTYPDFVVLRADQYIPDGSVHVASYTDIVSTDWDEMRGGSQRISSPIDSTSYHLYRLPTE